MADTKKKSSKILVVDDNPSARKTLRNMLKTIGYANVTDAEDGDVAFDMLKAGQEVSLDSARGFVSIE